ncbi:hypothetical protein ACEQUB_p01349 (plasmid) [Ralstonia syzygii]
MWCHASFNRLFRLAWNHATGMWVEVAGHAKCHRDAGWRGACEAAILLGGLTAGASALAAPVGGVVTSGSGGIGQSGATTTITQNTSKLAVDWSSFSIQAGETVNFIQPGAGAIALNRVTGRESSSILGSLNANGTVFILNPNGVLFGSGAQVNVGSLVASTLSLSNADFEAGRYAFSGGSTAGVSNQGTITVPSGGKIALIANHVENTGTLSAPGGSVLLAGTGNVTLTLADGSPLGYTIGQGAARTLVSNGGMIAADGGRVVLTARGLDSLSESVINTTGVVRARTVANHQGTIELAGDPATGVTQVSGQLDASAPEGGSGGLVKVLGAKVGVFDGARIDATGMDGGGTALIGGNNQGTGPEPNAAAYVAPTAVIDVSAIRRGDGGKLIVWGTDVANVHGTLSANGGAQGGNGGYIETSGHALDTEGIAASVAAGNGGGTGGLWLLDPYNVTISSGTQTGGTFSGNVWTPSANGSLVNTTSIQNVLNSGGSVTITTSGAGTQEGNIALNGNITKTAGGHASLALIADGRITTNASSGSHRTISSTSGALDVSMSARATTSASNTNGIGLRYVDISANGGNISATASGAQSATVAALDLENSTWSTTGSGSITLSGVLPSNGNSQGVYLKFTTLTTASGAITVSGTSGGIATITGTNSNGAALFSTANIGVDLVGANTLQSTGGGDITLSGTATGATATWAGSGVRLAGQNTLATTGALTINGTASNPVSSVYRNQLSTVAIVGSGSSATNLTGGTVSITGTNSVVGNSSSTSNSNAAVKLDGKVNLTATAGPINISGSNTGGDGVWGSGSGAVSMSAPASSSININALSLDSASGYSGFYIGGGSTLTFGTAAPVSITAQSLVSARRALWNKGGLITPGNLSIVATGGAIADDTTHGGYFQVGGTTSINSSGAGNAITLTNSGNAFNGALSLTAGDTTLASSAPLTLGASTVSGALNLTAPGITQSGAVTVSGTTTLNSGNAAIALTNRGNDFNALAVADAAGVNVVNAGALSVTGLASTGDVRLTTLAGDLTTRGNWSVSGGDLTLSAGADSTRGMASGGDVVNQATLAVDAGRTVTVYSGAVDSTVLGGSLAGRAAAGSGNFRYNKQDGDAPGASGIGDGATYIMYRERPTVTVTPTDAANTKVYDGGAANEPALAYTVAGQVNGDSAAQIFTGDLTRAAGQNAGSYALALGTLADQLGYQVVLAPNHAFSVTPAPLLVTADNATRAIGQDNPAFSATYTGLVGGQSPQTADLQGALRFFTDASVASPAGTYTVLPGGLTSNNYRIRYAAGTLSVELVSLASAMAGSTAGEQPYLGAVVDMQAKARLAGFAAAPDPAEQSETGWRTAATSFNRSAAADQSATGDRPATQK